MHTYVVVMDEGIIRTWILVADPRAARLFLSYPGQTGWFEQHALRWPAGEPEAEFVQELADYLDVHLERGRFERLVLVAPPAFLEQLRAALTSAVKRRVVETVQEDLVHLSSRELARQVDLHH